MHFDYGLMSFDVHSQSRGREDSLCQPMLTSQFNFTMINVIKSSYEKLVQCESLEHLLYSGVLAPNKYAVRVLAPSGRTAIGISSG